MQQMHNPQLFPPSWHERDYFNILKCHQWVITMDSNAPMKHKLRSGD